MEVLEKLPQRGKIIGKAFHFLGNWHDAEMAVDEAIFNAIRYYDRDRPTTFKSWFWTVLMNICRHFYRIKKRRETETLDSETIDRKIFRKSKDILSEVVDEEQKKFVWSLIEKKLTSMQKEVINYRLYNLSFEEIAKKMKKTEGSCRAQFHRAMLRIRAIVRKRYAKE